MNNNFPIKKSSLFLFIILFLISGCAYNVLDYSNVKNKDFQLSFASDVPNELKNKINSVFQDNSLSSNLNSNFIKISGFTIETYNIFSGKALRALEVEVKSSMSLTITIGNKTSKKKLMAMKRYNANELNILAEKEMLDFIKKEIYEDFLDQIVLEVGLIEV
jgi:outer membrane lipopolysaccharide assembly protein LptE/RlpB